MMLSEIILGTDFLILFYPCLGKLMHDLFHLFRTVYVDELYCIPYEKGTCISNQFETKITDLLKAGYQLTPGKLTVISLSDEARDKGSDNFERMHRIIMATNSLYEVLEYKQDNWGHANFKCLSNTYLVLTDNPNYLRDLIDIAHFQSITDDLTYKFNDTYGLTKKRKLNDTDL